MLEACKLSIGPIGWANDDIRGWGPETHADTVMRQMAETGFQGSEMSYLYPQDPHDLREVLSRHGLVLSGAYHWTNLGHAEHLASEIALARKHIDFCANAGATVAVVAEACGSLHWDRLGPRQSVAPLDDAAWTRLQQALHDLGTYARSRLVTLCVHPHGGTAIEGQADVQRLLDGSDAEVVGLCLDTGHSAYAGMDVLDVVRRWAPRVRYMHLKDVRADVLARRPSAFFEAIRADVFAAPGDGALDFRAILAVLEHAGYRGWLVVEADQDPGAHPALEVARQARAYLGEILGR